MGVLVFAFDFMVNLIVQKGKKGGGRWYETVTCAICYLILAELFLILSGRLAKRLARHEHKRITVRISQRSTALQGEADVCESFSIGEKEKKKAEDENEENSKFQGSSEPDQVTAPP